MATKTTLQSQDSPRRSSADGLPSPVGPPPSTPPPSTPPPSTPPPSTPPPSAPFAVSSLSVGFLVMLALATLVLIQPWIALVRSSLGNALYSYAMLVPIISAWLICQNSPSALLDSRRQWFPGLLLAVAGIACGYLGWRARREGQIVTDASWLSTQMGAWVLLVWAASFLFQGSAWIRTHLFALAFLAFSIPLPDPVVDSIEIALQDASATASDWLFSIAGTPYLRDGRMFWFPNLHIEVAQECSGIRSTLVLFITGVLGSHLLLRRFWHRTILVAVIVPLGILRNAIRILTLTLLSVHVNPAIMESALHKRGGPLFFAVSLVPLFLLFWWMSRRERKMDSVAVRQETPS